MTSRDFCYWLQGFFELSGKNGMSADQTAAVARHLDLVFKHEIDPSMGGPAHQEVLNEAHAPPKPSGTTGWPGGNGPTFRC